MAFSNEEKRQVYSVLKTKLKIAIQQEFYLEALLLEYAIIEDRLSSVLRSANLSYIQSDGKEISIQKKINKIKNAELSKRFPIYRRVPSDLMLTTEQWKEIRNNLVHKSCSRMYDNAEVKQCALDGEDIVRRVSNMAKNIKRAREKAEEKTALCVVANRR